MEATPAKSFAYKRLNGGREIRSITLQEGNYDDPISLTIEHKSLDQKPTYEALSHVWGPQNPSHVVRCSDGILAIGENLRNALLYLRRPDAARVLWIDQIAINQDDVDERMQQVNLMADIYSSASVVVVWLGLADGSSESAFGLIVEQKKVSDFMYKEYELIDSIENAKLPIYIPVRKIGGQPLYSESPFRLSRS
jgi:hypothetical protein